MSTNDSVPEQSPLTRDDVRAIVSEEIGKLGGLLATTSDFTGSTGQGLKFDDGANEVPDRVPEYGRLVSSIFIESFFEAVKHGATDGVALRKVDTVKLSGHETSPSVDDAGAHSVGDGPGAGDASATPATEVTDNWDTGKMAGHVEVIKVDGDPTQLLIDGEPFPYLLAAEPFKVLAGEDDATRVTVTLFAEKITESERLTSDPSKPYVHFSRGGFPATEATLELLVAAVRDANLDIKSLRRIDEAALANYNESGRNLAKAIKNRTDSERALLDYLTGDRA